MCLLPHMKVGKGLYSNANSSVTTCGSETPPRWHVLWLSPIHWWLGWWLLDYSCRTTNQWHTVTPLPCPLRHVTAVVHGNEVCVAATNGSLYTCTLQSFLSPKQRWKQFPCPAPLWDSTVTSFCNELIAIWGASVNMEAKLDVYHFFENKWILCGSLCKARWDCLVAVLPGTKVIVVGGGTAVDSDSVDVLASH